MDFLKRLIASVTDASASVAGPGTITDTYASATGPISVIVNKTKQTCFLDQGKTLLNNQYKREVLFNSNTSLLEKDSSLYGSMIEGFTGAENTEDKNNQETAITNRLNNDFNKNITRYNNEYPALLTDARSYTQKTDRNANVKKDLQSHVDLLYDIKANKEGCYKSSNNNSDYKSNNSDHKSSNNSGFLFQSDMQNVSEKTCKTRAFDEGYAGFSIKKGANGQLGCFLTNDIQSTKKNEIAIKPMTSYAFKTNKDANIGGLLFNGQVGTYKDNMDTNLLTDLDEVSVGEIGSCNIKDGTMHINDKSIIATYGGNCKKSS